MTNPPEHSPSDAPAASLITYPCQFPIKVMGIKTDQLVPALTHIAQQFDPGFDPGTVELRPSKAGNYLGVTLTVTAIVITGILGNMTAVAACKIFRLRSPIAKGLAVGTSAHAIGTTKAMEMGEIEGAVSSLAIVITGLGTVVAANLFAYLY